MRVALALSMLGVLAAGCDRPPLTIGVGCVLNTDCDHPLVCGLERCRRQCVDSRDCGAGLLCLQIGDRGGACQLPDEVMCSLTSDCDPGLVCRFGTCTTECVEDRDCRPGASCELDEGADGMACVEPVTDLCVYNSDCPPPRVCNDDQRCVLECDESTPPNRDCPEPRICVEHRCVLPDGG